MNTINALMEAFLSGPSSASDEWRYRDRLDAAQNQHQMYLQLNELRERITALEKELKHKNAD
jgi:hypothetical protein